MKKSLSEPRWFSGALLELSAFPLKLCVAFRTGDTDISLSFRNPYLLPAVWAGINVVCFPVLHVAFAAEERCSHFVFDLQEFYILLVTLLAVA